MTLLDWEYIAKHKGPIKDEYQLFKNNRTVFVDRRDIEIVKSEMLFKQMKAIEMNCALVKNGKIVKEFRRGTI